jgi:hypothetical protein
MQLASISRQDLSILKNREIIAINQDPVVGTSISPFRWGINVRLLFSSLVRRVSYLLEGLGVQFLSSGAVLEWRNERWGGVHAGENQTKTSLCGLFIDDAKKQMVIAQYS